MISKEQLQKNFEQAKDEYKEGLQLILDTLNQGQRKKLLKDDKVRKIFERFGVITE